MPEFNKTTNIIAIVTPLLIVGLLYLYAANPQDRFVNNVYQSENSKPIYTHIKMLDTIHLLGDEYIEIFLNKQIAVLHRRNDSSLTFKISTGSSRLAKGVKTPSGLYTIQTKLEVAVSKQFNNAKLYYWLGFNGNIGFHGLHTSGYYSHLGQRTSSHGCVRISREDAKSLYLKVHRGTPVISHSVSPAIRLVFSDYSQFNPAVDFFLTSNSRINNSIMKKRLYYLQKGLALSYNIGRPFIDGRTIIRHRGLTIGIDSLIPDHQLPPIFMTKIYCSKKDKLLSTILIDKNTLLTADTAAHKKMKQKD